MSATVAAPSGYDAVREYVDAAREWRIAWRQSGATWWITGPYIGHPHLTDEELDLRAVEAVARDIQLRTGSEVQS